MKLLLALLFLASTAAAQTCPSRINLRPVPATSRGGTIIYKSNWNLMEDRENTIEEGNHSQKGAALLIHYKARKYLPAKNYLDVRDSSCKSIARMGRFPRCTSAGCGDYERWYLRAPGGSQITVSELSKRSGQLPILVRLAGRQWAVVQNVYSDREVYP